MDGKRLFDSIRLRNLLSYGPEGVQLKLEPLNVLIGPNAAGKSNLLDAISLLAAAPRNLLIPFRDGGSVEDWLYKGGDPSVPAFVSVQLAGRNEPEEYLLSLGASGSRLDVGLEAFRREGFTYFARDAAGLSMRSPGGVETRSGMKSVFSQQSVLSQFRDPINFPEMTELSNQLERITFFRDWPFGRGNVLRRPQDVNLPNDFLLEDGSNLGLVLNDLETRRASKLLLVEKLKKVYDGLEDVRTKVQGGTIQIFFYEEGIDRPIPAARISDGTLHYLSLLTILLHPDPPPLLCIEEPEVGLHPDVIPIIADLLRDASQRTQLIVTTHSETLVSRLSDVPEAIVVCERDGEGTHLRRLEPEKLREWLDKYMLGELWRMGEIGGNRW
ncbi:MAG: AAA family ATPase [Thermoanaerobaculia bacterium]